MIIHAVNSTGEFKIDPRDFTPNHCGVGGNVVHFLVRCEGTLDERGFVIDVRECQAYFVGLYERKANRVPVPSCEAMADAAVDYLRARMGKRGTRVLVRIKASEFGYAEADWKVADAPTLPALKGTAVDHDFTWGS